MGVGFPETCDCVVAMLYSSSWLGASPSSTCDKAKPERTTSFSNGCQASPMRGSKLLLSSWGWVICPSAPDTSVSGRLGLNCENCPYLVCHGLSFMYRTPRFKVRVGDTFQSSWKYTLLILSRGSQLAVGTEKLAVLTEPSMKEARRIPPVLAMVCVPDPVSPLAPSNVNTPLGLPRL